MRGAGLGSRRALVAMLLCSCLAAAAVGCGGSDEENGGDPHAALIAQANRLCSEATERYERMPPVYITTYDEVVPGIIRNELALARRLGALKAPKRDRPALERLAEVLKGQAAEIDKAEFAYTHLDDERDYPTYKRHLRRARQLDGEVAAAARALGARACVEPPLLTAYL